MKLSVVMAAANNAETIETAVTSILKQSFGEFEFIIIADGSTDGTVSKLKDLAGKDNRIKLIINKKRLGLTPSLNLGLKAAGGAIIARMDADDASLPDRFRLQLGYLNEHKNIGLLGTGVNLIDGRGKRLRVKKLPTVNSEIKSAILKYCPFIHPTWMVRRSVLNQVGVYNEDFIFAQDYELALRIAARFPVANLPEPLLNYRVNSTSAISLKNLKQQEWLAIKARFLALSRYGYSWLESWKLIKPLLSFLLPGKLKLVLYRRFFW